MKYDRVSRIGLKLASPTGLPSRLRLPVATRPLTIVPPTREHDLGAEVIVTHFWSDLSIAVVGVNGVGFIIVVGVRGQVFGREIQNC